jgi:hypothetical protein
MDTAKQMQMAFMMEEGGLTDDGTTMDPVSGNEVPPGSMAEEVRDDVPAQLSEGEYVVPADVVRFYGVKFFEDLRTEAKRGLMDMEANGRIGGEPVAQTIDNRTGGELTPEELAALEQITGMAVGGTVQPTQSTNPYLQQQQMYQNPAPVAMGNTGQYNKGGQVLYAAPGTDVSTGTGITNPATNQEANIDPYTQQFGAQQGSMFSPGYLIDQTLGTASNPVRTVTMYGPNGEVETLTLPAQQARYEELVEMGYSETPVQTTTETTVADDPGGVGSPEDLDRPEAVDYTTLSNEELTEALSKNNIANNIALGLMATIPAVGAFAKMAAAHQRSQIVAAMKEKGMEPPEDDNILTNIIETVKDIIDPNKDKDKTPPTPPTPPSPVEEETSYTPGDGTRLRDTATNAGDEAASIQEEAAKTGKSIAEIGREMAPSTAETQTDVEEATGGQGDQGLGSGAGGMNQGGMVKRRNKKKK